MTSHELSGCVIVTGMPGAGKTTMTAMPRAAQVKGDDVTQMIRTGRVWFLGKPADEAIRHYEMCRRRAVRLVTLAPGIATCQARNAMRDVEDRFDFDAATGGWNQRLRRLHDV